MATLQEMLLAPEIKPQVITDCEALVSSEVDAMSGVSGAAVRLAYKTVRTFDAGHIQVMIHDLLPEIADALQPYWADFTAAGDGEFGGYLAEREDAVAESLLAITDDRATWSKRPTIVKAYKTVRGSAAKQVKAALPAVGTLIQKYAI
jgi:hypothetical protein